MLLWLAKSPFNVPPIKIHSFSSANKDKTANVVGKLIDICD